MRTPTIWGLWDCGELISVHLTHSDALDALAEHLERCRCFTEDLDLIRAAVEIHALPASGDSRPVDNPIAPSTGPHDGKDRSRPHLSAPDHFVGELSHANR